jgi:hypothetical protein
MLAKMIGDRSYAKDRFGHGSDLHASCDIGRVVTKRGHDESTRAVNN